MTSAVAKIAAALDPRLKTILLSSRQFGDGSWRFQPPRAEMHAKPMRRAPRRMELAKKYDATWDKLTPLGIDVLSELRREQDADV